MPPRKSKAKAAEDDTADQAPVRRSARTRRSVVQEEYDEIETEPPKKRARSARASASTAVNYEEENSNEPVKVNYGCNGFHSFVSDASLGEFVYKFHGNNSIPAFFSGFSRTRKSITKMKSYQKLLQKRVEGGVAKHRSIKTPPIQNMWPTIASELAVARDGKPMSRSMTQWKKPEKSRAKADVQLRSRKSTRVTIAQQNAPRRKLRLQVSDIPQKSMWLVRHRLNSSRSLLVPPSAFQ